MTNKKRCFAKVFSVLNATVLLFATYTGSVPVAEAREHTPLGMGFSLPNYPNGNADDLLVALSQAREVGSHMSFVWSWKNQWNVPFLDNVIPLLDSFELHTLLQIAPTALGNPVPPEGYAKTFADQAVRSKFLDDVRHFAEFEPEYLNLCAEVNLMYHLNIQEFRHFSTLYQEAYDLVKSISPDTKVGVSLLNVLFVGYRQFPIVYELGPVDFIGLTTYPEKLIDAGTLPPLAEFPREYYEVVKLVYPDKPILITEVGWSSKGVSSPEEQAEFVRAMPWLFETLQPELINWTLLHDTNFFQADNLSPEAEQILADLGVDPEELFSRFNGMGLFNLDGTPKPAWTEALQLDFANPVPPPFVP